MSDQPTGTPGEAPKQAPDQGQAPVSPPLPHPARPAQPAYGEYAPEGWEWKPEGEDTVAAASPAGGPSAPQARPAGVPHNLGAVDRPADQAKPAEQQTAGGPYRAAPPTSSGSTGSAGSAPQHSAQFSAPQATGQVPPAYRATGPARPRLGDRVITIVLLVIGGFGALNTAGSFFGLESQIRLTATMLGLENPSVAGWIGPLGVVSGLLVLLLFALTLIFSIQRMRANKLTFWVPLTAGAVAFIILMIVPMVALAGAPEIMEQLQNDPTGSLDKMLDYVAEMQTP